MSDWHNWQAAFLKQARSDWEAYQKTAEFKWPHCHRLHYLQMGTEKLSKALLVAGDSDIDDITRSHIAFVQFMRAAGKNRKLQKALGLKKSPLKMHFKKLLPLAHEIGCSLRLWRRRGPIPNIPGKMHLETLCRRLNIHFLSQNYFKRHPRVFRCSGISRFLSADLKNFSCKPNLTHHSHTTTAYFHALLFISRV